MAIDEPGRTPGGQDGQVAPAQPRPCGVRVVRRKEGVGQSVHGEDLADVDQPAGQLQDRDEHPGQEAQRQDDGQHGGLGRVDVGDEAGHGEAQAAEDHGADDDVEEKAGPVRPGMCAANAAQPMASKTAVIASTDTAATSARAAMTALAGQGSGATALVDAGLPVADHRDDQVGERRGDEAVGDDAGDVVHRLVDSPARHGDVLVLKYRPEDRKEHDREGECEEHALLVAVKAAQVGAELVDGQVPDLVAGASGVAGVVAEAVIGTPG